ncbi:hypothetical protein SAMN05216483_6685 [Streptomyces sp. 2131.1]|uniref:hypothetical protein n=1 Tax=Streptomyces sp. 2131.1 TaxID=1855346 RepID=UPI00089800A1|nr:hypothetical protein [Streptomyces sp. 2131.1]SEE82884.1 hypothetical protein SAMN05216483_6685 [Streptomyces sp. 2131.1]
MSTTTAPVVNQYAQAGQRARTVAEIARDRFTTDPNIRAALYGIAERLDAAAREFDAVPPGAYEHLPLEATEELFMAEQIAVEHPAARFPADLGEYVLVPLVDRELPLPHRLNPVNPGFEEFGRREAEQAHALHLLHDDGPHQWERTDDWLRQVFKVWEKRLRLEAEVHVDNARPCNRR